jgi:uncharacterized damage-inducible protein DinB
MDIKQAMIAEFKRESENTKKILSIIPSEKFNWKPHDKSMVLIELSQHIAGLTRWADLIIRTSELDVRKREKPCLPENTVELLNYFDKNASQSLDSLEKVTDEELQQVWTIRRGEHIILSLPKAVAIRTICFNHIYHHRGQLSVYLRLLDVKIPGMYGPSADEVQNIKSSF